MKRSDVLADFVILMDHYDDQVHDKCMPGQGVKPCQRCRHLQEIFQILSTAAMFIEGCSEDEDGLKDT